MLLLKEFFSGEFNVEKISALTKSVKLLKTESPNDQFELSYDKNKKPPTESEIQAFMKGRTVEING